MKRARGVTLIEALIVLSMITVLLALVTMYFTRGQQYTADTDAYSSLQREANITLSRMKEHLYRSTIEHLEVGLPSNVYFLSFRPVEPDEPDIEFGGPRGEVTWKKWIGFFLEESSGTVFQSEIPLSPATHSLTPRPDPAVDFGSFLSAPRKVIGHRAESLSFEKSGNAVTIRLTVKGASPVPQRTENDKIIRLNSSMRVSLTN